MAGTEMMKGGTDRIFVACLSAKSETAMSDALRNSWRAATAALLRSYAADLRRWAAGLVASYAIAGALLAGGVLTLFAAIAVAITALFHFIERHYGMNAAYGGIGGGLFVLAIVLVLSGWLILRRRVPRLPRGNTKFASILEVSGGRWPFIPGFWKRRKASNSLM